MKYCKLTIDSETGRPRGTGFVHFWKKEDADKVLEEAALASSMIPQDLLIKSSSGHSSLQPETTSGFWLHGRQLFVMLAVDRGTANRFDQEKSEKITRDGRNMHLLKEGYIRAGSQAAQDLKPGELVKREAAFQERKRKLKNYPHLFVARNRLSIRNLPKTVDEKQLRTVAKECADQWLKEVLALEKDGRLGKTERLELERIRKEERMVRKPFVKQVKLIRDKSRVDAKELQKLSAKEEGGAQKGDEAAPTKQPTSAQKKALLGQSKGYGFLEFTSHIHALGCLRRMNNNPDLFPGRRPIVEFAIEDKNVLNKRMSRHDPVALAKKDAKKEKFGKKDKKVGDKEKPSAASDDADVKPRKSKRDNSEDAKPRKSKHDKSEDVKPRKNKRPSSDDASAAPQKSKKQKTVAPKQIAAPISTTTKRTAVTGTTAAAPTKTPKKSKIVADAFDDMVSKYKSKLSTDNSGPKTAAARWFE